jgi:alkylation response protein AidB-like acyl-CoA dehydrogenase
MNFQLTDEQQMLRDSVERFGAEHYAAQHWLREVAAGGASSRSRWRKMADNGWLALAIPAGHGGLDGSAVDVMALMEGFGRHLIFEPFVSSCVLAPALIAHGGGETATMLLAAIGSGAAQVAPAIAEADSGFDLHRVATVARAHGAGFRLTGLKSHAVNGADADWFIVPARTRGLADDRDGISLFLVARIAPGLSVESYRSIDHHRHARVRLEDVFVETPALLGPLHGGFPLLEKAVDHAIAAHLAEAVGCMDALSEMTLAYLKSRRQFGVAIGSFQALQHRMVDIAIACEEARSMLYHATLHLQADDLARRRAVSAAKARIGQTGLFVGRQAVQLHGGIGATDELIVSHYLKRLMMIDLAYGNLDYHRALFAGTEP